MTIRHVTTSIAVLATLLFATACEEEPQTEPTTPAQTAPEPENAPEPTGEQAEPAAEQQPQAEPAQAEGAGGSVCQRAVGCCEAYVAAMAANTPGVTADSTCAGVRQAQNAPGGDASCTAAIAAWRTSLTQLGQTVPSACAE